MTRRHSLLLWGALVVAVGCVAAPTLVSAQVTETCPTVTENCTAGDMDVFNATATPYLGDTCGGPSDTINVEVSVSFQTSGGADRFDLAVWVPVDVVGPTCEGREVNPTNSSGTTDFDSDVCYDIDGADTVVFTGVFAIPCLDNDNDGSLDDFPVTGSWYQPGGNVVCTGPEFAGTTAKCETTVSAPDIAVPNCGNFIVESGEDCDDGPTGSTTCTATCETIPTSGPYCGDGIVNGDEACDDGNGSNTDACLNTCVAATCGDGFVEDGVEPCDDGPFGSDTCTPDCRPVSPPDPVPSMPGRGLAALLLLSLATGVLVLHRARLERR